MSLSQVLPHGSRDRPHPCTVWHTQTPEHSATAPEAVVTRLTGSLLGNLTIPCGRVASFAQTPREARTWA